MLAALAAHAAEAAATWQIASIWPAQWAFSFCSVTSEANFTTLKSLPFSSRISSARIILLNSYPIKYLVSDKLYCA